MMNGKQLSKILKENGWILDRIKGSHHIFIKEGNRAVPVPIHGGRDIPVGLARTILKQAGIKEEK